MTVKTDLNRLIHPDEALGIVLEYAKPGSVETVPLVEAGWRVLAADLVATENHPPFAASTMDGYAVVAEDGSPWREVLGVQKAGEVLPLEVTDGMAVKIMTGAPIPAGANAVVPVENTEVADDHVIINQEQVRDGENIRPIGVDVRIGDLLVPAGTRIGPAEIGLAAGMGHATLSVYRKPRVSVLTTGDELVEPGEPLGPGQIRDSNRFSIITALIAEGADIVWSGKAPDERGPLEALMRERIADSDILITSGGVSMGDLDLVKALLGEMATVHIQKLLMKPGKPLNFATAGDTLIFGLPGNPVSTLATLELFLRPALSVIAGRGPSPRPRVSVTLTTSMPPTDRIEYARGFVSVGADGLLYGSPNGKQASSRLASFAGGINAFLIIPADNRPRESGEQVEAMLLGAPVVNN
ncbi:MAG: molybdopterin molybdotransferase MoeA [Thermomicrobiales bacterium]